MEQPLILNFLRHPWNVSILAAQTPQNDLFFQVIYNGKELL